MRGWHVVKIASFNVENLFARPKVFKTAKWSEGEPILKAYADVNALFAKASYSAADKRKIRDLLVKLDIYFVNDQGAVRRRETQSPKWALLRANRGKFDRQPEDRIQSMEIVANGRSDWIGWVELAKEPTDETGTRLTAKVIHDVDADIIAIVEAEDRPSLVRFNEELLGGRYRHAMLVDGNDERGIDVGLMTGPNFEIESIRSNVDAEDGVGTIFSRDCPEYRVRTPSGATVYVLVNHFKSKSGGGGQKRQRQAAEVRRFADRLIAQNHHVVILGDFNEGPPTGSSQAVNLNPLYANSSPLVDCYSLATFSVGGRPGTFDSCGLSNRFDYMFISQSLQPFFQRGGLFRKGLWGSRKTRPTDWDTYPDITKSTEQASDHAAVFIDLNI